MSFIYAFKPALHISYLVRKMETQAQNTLNIDEVINMALKYLDELKAGDRLAEDKDIRKRIVSTIRLGAYLKREGRELKETVEYFEVKYIDKKTGNEEECKIFRAPYVRVGEVEVIQRDAIDESQNVQELEWGVPEKNEFSVKCIVGGEWERDGEEFIERGRGCSVKIKIVPKTPIVYIEYDEDNGCWLNSRVIYVYVHPYGWFWY